MVAAHLYAVIGEECEGGVRHVGLLASGTEVTLDSKVPVFERGPEFFPGPKPGSMTAHLVARVRNAAGDARLLSREEEEAIGVWLKRLQPQLDPRRSQSYLYTAYPAWKEEVKGERETVWLSCTGFVTRAYFEAGIDLIPGIWKTVDPLGPDVIVEFNEDPLPEIPRDLAQEIWPGSPEKHHELGLVGKGPWRLLMPGYIFHALARPLHTPYEPLEDHRRYP